MIALMVPLMAQTMVPTRPLLTMQFSTGLASSFIFIIGILRKDFRAGFHLLRVSLPEFCPYHWRFIAMRQGKAQAADFSRPEQPNPPPEGTHRNRKRFARTQV
uniref:Uncharacterized protein n=1 Tax=Anopheles coluzzii TaxID=1518534 RepID=A0A8W7P1U8_ANOCL